MAQGPGRRSRGRRHVSEGTPPERAFKILRGHTAAMKHWRLERNGRQDRRAPDPPRPSDPPCRGGDGTPSPWPRTGSRYDLGASLPPPPQVLACGRLLAHLRPLILRLRPREFRSRPLGTARRTSIPWLSPLIFRPLPLIFRPLPLKFRHLPSIPGARGREGASGERGVGDKISEGSDCPLRFCIAGREGADEKGEGGSGKPEGGDGEPEGRVAGAIPKDGKPLGGCGEGCVRPQLSPES